MRDSRAICILCSARQSFLAAARRGALSSGSSRTVPTRGRWHTTAASAGTTTPSAAPGADSSGHGGQSEAAGLAAKGGFVAQPRVPGSNSGPPRRQLPRLDIAASTPRANAQRRRRPRQAEDAALAVFRDIVESQRQPEHGQKLRGKTPEEDNGDGNPDRPSFTQTADLKKQKQRHQQHQQQRGTGRNVHGSMELYDQLVKLTQMQSQPGMTAARLFAFFETAVYPHMADTPRDLPNVFRAASQQLVRDVSAAKQRDYHAPDLPSVARITQIRRQLALLNMPEPWVLLVIGLVEEITQTAPRRPDAAAKDKAEAEAETARSEEGGKRPENHGTSPAVPSQPDGAAAQRREALLNDLVETWRVFSLPDLIAADPAALAEAPPTEFRLPTPDPALLAKYAQKRNMQLALSSLFPRFAPRQLRPVVPAVLASYAALTDPALSTPAAQDKAREFLDAVAHVLSSAVTSRHAVARTFAPHPALGAYVLERWPLVAAHKTGNGPLPSLRSLRYSKSSSLNAIHKELSHALRGRNLEACEAAWERFWSAVSAPDVEGAELLRNSAEMFDFFIMAFTTMRMPNRAIAVWNLMAMAGVQPTLRTWTSFMEGCKLASNPTGIHSIWEKLVASGTQVDTAVWTARIAGLMQAGETEAGMQALEEMQRLWEEERGGEASRATGSGGKAKPATTPTARPTKAVKPTIEPVNAAIAGVLRMGDLASAKKILAWAGRHGIGPDLITFNTILRPLVREGHGDEAAGLLEMMRQRGIQPDEATVTILLDAALGGGAMAGRSAAEQAETVKRVLAEMEAAGLDANQLTYAKIIHLLLTGGDEPHAVAAAGNEADAAVEVVLDRMRQRGLVLSSPICTILAEHYFSRSPPDLDAVRTLIESGQPPASAVAPAVAPLRQSEPARAKSPAAGFPAPMPVFDRVFWERVVRGFAQVGDTASAQRYFANIADSQSLTGSTLEDLLRALIRSGEWDAAAQLVSKVQAQKTLLVQGGDESSLRPTDARLFRHRFWHLAAEHGLLQQS